MSDCRCSEEIRERKFDAEKSYDQLSQKYTQLVDLTAAYMSEAGLKRSLRVENAAGLEEALIRIVGGRPTNLFPECCLIGNSERFFCTGVLVNPRIVLTAAHCQRSGITRVGLNCVSSSDPAMEAIEVQRIAVHREYHRSTKINDIAVLILPKPAQTQPVPMASTHDLKLSRESTLVGFGNNNFSGTSGFGLKREVSVPIDVHSDINDAEARLGFESDVEYTAGGNGKDTCNGDSGGPAYIVINGGFKVAGLTSRPYFNFGQPCGEGGVYTRVDAHSDFIRHVAAQNGIEI